MLATATDFETAAGVLAKMLVQERSSNADLQDRYNDLAQFTASMFQRDRSDLLQNASITVLDDDLTPVDVITLRDQRDQARRIAVHLEGENAALLEKLERVRAYANELLPTYTASDYGVDLLTIVNGGEPTDDPA